MSVEALALTWCVELTLALLWFVRRLNVRRFGKGTR